MKLIIPIINLTTSVLSITINKELDVPVPIKKNFLLGNGHGKLSFISEKELREHASCKNLLAEGEWSQFKYKPGEQNEFPYTKNPLAWTYSGEFVPSHCQLIDFASDDLKNCVAADREREYIHFIGDSRTRLLYRAAVATYQNRPIETVDFHDDAANYPFKFNWGSSFDGEPIIPETKQGSGLSKLIANYDNSQLIVIGEHVLHPIFDLIEHNPDKDQKWYWSVINKYFDSQLNYFEKNIVPQLRYVDNTKSIVIMSFEGNLKTYGGKWSKEDWEKFQKLYNGRMEKIADNNKGIYFMKINSLTIWGPKGEQLSADWTHKLIPESPQEMPDALKADIAFLFNFHCNSKMNLIEGYRDNQVCCLFKD